MTLQFSSHVADSGSESVRHITNSLADAAGYDLEQLEPHYLRSEFWRTRLRDGRPRRDCEWTRRRPIQGLNRLQGWRVRSLADPAAEDGRKTLRFSTRVADSGFESVRRTTKSLAYAAVWVVGRRATLIRHKKRRL